MMAKKMVKIFNQEESKPKQIGIAYTVEITDPIINYPGVIFEITPKGKKRQVKKMMDGMSIEWNLDAVRYYAGVIAKCFIGLGVPTDEEEKPYMNIIIEGGN